MFVLDSCTARVFVPMQYSTHGGKINSTQGLSPPYDRFFPLGPLVLSKGIYVLRAPSTDYHPFPLSQVKILSRRHKTKREIYLFRLQSQIYSRKISALTAHANWGCTSRDSASGMFVLRRKLPVLGTLHCHASSRDETELPETS